MRVTQNKALPDYGETRIMVISLSHHSLRLNESLSADFEEEFPVYSEKVLVFCRCKVMH